MSNDSTHRLRRNTLRQWIAIARESLAAELWPLPTIAIVVGVAVGIFLPMLDRAVDADLPLQFEQFVFGGGPESARAVLSAISGSLITATSLTFSLTVVALQLASSQASPRVLRTFMKDQTVHWTLAIFVGTFAYSLTVLRTVRDATDDVVAIVPRLAVTLASLLTLLSVVMLIIFLAQLARQLRIETTLQQVFRETTSTIELVASTMSTGAVVLPQVPPNHRSEVARASRSGFIRSSDRSRLLSLATHHDIVIREETTIGSHVVEGTPVAWWWLRDPQTYIEEEKREQISESVAGAFGMAYERTPSQDIGFGLRQLVDIAARALSSGVNDPTTAVHSLGHISAILCALTALPEQSPAISDDDGTVRVMITRHDFTDLLELALNQPRRYGASDPDVAARLYQLLQEVGYVSTRVAQRTPLKSQLSRLDASVAAGGYDSVERKGFDALSASARAAITQHRWK